MKPDTLQPTPIDNLQETNQLLEAILVQGQKNDVAPLIEAQIVQTKQQSDKLIDALAPTREATSQMAAFLSEMKGPKGDKGDRGDKGDSIQGERGDKGEPGADSTVPGPAGRDGADGRDGVDGRDGRDGVDGKDGRDGKDGKPGPKGDAGKPDTESLSIIAKLKRQIESLSRNITSNMVTYRVGGNLVSNGSVLNLVAGSNITLTPTTDKDGATVTISSTGGGGGGSLNVETPTGSVNGTNTSFTVTTVPQWIDTDTGHYYEGFGYTRSSLTITMDLAPNTFIRAVS